MRRCAVVALAVALAGFSPFRAEERNVRDGNERLASGDAAGALRHYEDAEKAAGARPEIAYDRGNALYRLGRGAEARETWRRSQERGTGSLSSRASQNIGTALAAEGDRDGAIAAFVEALRRDPRNEDARFDLEVLLRRKQEEQQQQAAAAAAAAAAARAGPAAGAGAARERGRARVAEAAALAAGFRARGRGAGRRGPAAGRGGAPGRRGRRDVPPGGGTHPGRIPGAGADRAAARGGAPPRLEGRWRPRLVSGRAARRCWR